MNSVLIRCLSEKRAFFYTPTCLEAVVQTDADDVVCSAVGVGAGEASAQIATALHRVVAVECAEIAHVQTHLLVKLESATKAH